VVQKQSRATENETLEGVEDEIGGVVHKVFSWIFMR
jgi:hypothetical protein